MKYSAHIKRFLLLVIVAFSVLGGNAQVLSDSLSREVNQNALELILRYQTEAYVFSPDQYKSFSKLFDSEEVKIANDILPLNQLNEQVNIKDYPILLNKHCKEFPFTINLSAVNILPISIQTDKRGSLEVLVNKAIESKSKFSNRYQDTVLLKFIIQFDLDKNEYKISDIQPAEQRGKYLIVHAEKQKLFSTNKKNMSDMRIKIKDSFYKLDQDSKLFLKDINSNLVIQAENRNIIKPIVIPYNSIGISQNETQDPNQYNLNFKESVLHTGIRLGLGIPAVAPIQTTFQTFDSDIVTQHVKSFEGSVLLGIRLWQSEKSKILLNTDISYQSISFDLSLQQHKIINTSEYDPDNDQYIRTTEINNLTEQYNISLLSLPIKLEYRYYIKPKIGISLDAGVRFGQIYTAQHNTNLNGNISGQYEQYFNITLAENGVYDFGDYEDNYQSDLQLNSNFIAPEIGVNFIYKLNRQYAFTGGLQYGFGLTNLNNNSNGFNEEFINDETSFLNTAENIKYSKLNINLGLLIKL